MNSSAHRGSGPPPLHTAVLAHIAADWPELAAIRGAAGTHSHKQRLQQTVSIAINEVRVALASALLSRQALASRAPDAREDERQDEAAIARAHRIYGHARAIVSDGQRAMADLWCMHPDQCALVIDQLAMVVGPARAAETRPAPGGGTPTSGPRPARQPFSHGVFLFHAAVAQGMPLARALDLFGSLSTGAFSHDDRCFYPESSRLGALADRVSALHAADRVVIRGGIGERDTTLFLVDNEIAAIASPAKLRSGWVEDLRKAAGGLESLPDWIALPRDEEGRPILPKSRVTALVEAGDAWATQIGPLDAVTATITKGRLVMPKVSAPTQQTHLRNHPSWENDEAAKRALGPVIAKWLASGVLEYVEWNDRVPLLLQPCGAVPKGTAPFYRLITDARHANNIYADWGVTYTTAAQLSSTLNRCDFTFSIDISDAYHLALWAGCGGELRPIRRPVLASADGPGGRLTWIDAMVNGCTPFTCRGGCDKDLSGIMIEGHIFRFASCQFGQKTAGSPLGAIVRSVARFFARLPTPVHVAAWVDDLIFVMSTPEHGICEGFAGGCVVCQEYHERAVGVQTRWTQLAAELKIPLSGKGHPVGQCGSFTGVGIDTFRGVFHMLPDKLKSMFEAREQLCASVRTTPRLISRVRGKVLHYGCAIPFVQVAAASLSQAMHDRETGVGPTVVPTLEEENDMTFAWDREIALSDRARRALAFIEEAMSRYGDHGQPIWPAVPSSFFRAFQARQLGPVRALVITYDASVHGWGTVIRTDPDDPGLVVVGGYRVALDILGRQFLDPSGLGEFPAAQVYRETLAGFLATHAASQHFALADFTVLIRGDCWGALSALRKGSFRSPAMQDTAIAFNELFMRVRASPPLFLHTPGTQLVQEGTDGLSRAEASERRKSEATRALRDIVIDQARFLEQDITIDLFATADNTLVPRFFSAHWEPLAEGANALLQPDWGCSVCPRCGQAHRETAYAFPPRHLLPPFVAKARADGLRGVIVVPFITSHAMWPTLMAASLTPPVGSFNRCVVVPAGPSYVRHGDPMFGTQRLAIMAVDFTRVHPRTLPGLAPPCPRAADLRPRPSLASDISEDDRTRIRAEIAAAGLTERARKRSHPQ